MKPVPSTPACTWVRPFCCRVVCGCGWHFTARTNNEARRAHHRHVYLVRLSVGVAR